MSDRMVQKWDEYGRGLLLAASQDAAGIKPHLPREGLRSLLYAVRDSTHHAVAFPDQFAAMLGRAVRELSLPLIETLLAKIEELEAKIKAVEANQEKIIDARLEPVRKAFVELRAEIKAMKAGGVRPAVRTQAPRSAMSVQ